LIFVAELFLVREKRLGIEGDDEEGYLLAVDAELSGHLFLSQFGPCISEFAEGTARIQQYV